MPALDRAEAEFMVPQHVPMTVIMRVAAFAVLALSLIVVPGSPARASTTCFAYVTDALSNNVSVIDTAANTVTATIPVGVSPLGEGTGCRTGPHCRTGTHPRNAQVHRLSQRLAGGITPWCGRCTERHAQRPQTTPREGGFVQLGSTSACNQPS